MSFNHPKCRAFAGRIQAALFLGVLTVLAAFAGFSWWQALAP